MLELQDRDIQLKGLKVLVEDTEKSVLCFALYNSFSDVEKVQDILSKQLSVDVVIEGLKADTPNLFDGLEKLGTQNRSVVFMVYQGHTDAELRRVAGFANLQRERLQEFPHVVVFCLSKTSFPKFIEQAPDFWAWRSGGLLDFQTQGIPVVQDFGIERVNRSSDSNVYESYQSEVFEKQINDYLAIIETQKKSKKTDLAYIARTYIILAELSGKVGDFEKALFFSRQALDISEQLDDKALIANSLNSIGIYLLEFGDIENSLKVTEKAVEIRQILAQAQPDYFMSGLAQSLNNLGKRYSILGKHETALEVTQKAVEIFEDLINEQPTSFWPSYAQTLSNLGGIFKYLGRYDEAVHSSEEAVKIRKQLVEEQSDIFLPDLAQSLSNLGAIFDVIDRQEEALNTTLESLEIYQNLADILPEAYMPDLARIHNNLGVMYKKMGRREEALIATKKSVITLKPFFFKNPNGYEDWMRTFLTNHLKNIEDIGKKMDYSFIADIQMKLQELEQ